MVRGAVSILLQMTGVLVVPLQHLEAAIGKEIIMREEQGGEKEAMRQSCLLCDKM